MGWFKKLLHKETDTVRTIYELRSWMNAIGFSVTEIDSVSRDELVSFDRFKAQRGSLNLVVVWDGEVATFLQNQDFDGRLINYDKYQEFHVNKRYFVITYGQPNNAIIVKHSVFMSNETPIIAASVDRVMQTWDSLNLHDIIVESR